MNSTIRNALDAQARGLPLTAHEENVMRARLAQLDREAPASVSFTDEALDLCAAIAAATEVQS
jgi:hypothetical protein